MERVSERRDELLERVVDALLADGVADLSLRPLAERVGTSARLLIYHFETKEKLIARALAEVRSRVEASLRALVALERPASLREVLMMFWAWALEEPHQGYFRLLFEVDGLSMYQSVDVSEEGRRDNTSIWLKLIGRWLAAADPVPSQATLILAALSGLLQDFLSTGERGRTTAALLYLLDRLPGETLETKA